METIKTILYIGHHSSFGLAFLESVLQSPFFKIEHVIIPEFNQYILFKSRLKKRSTPERRDLISLQKEGEKKQEKISNLLQPQNISLKSVADANQIDHDLQLNSYDVILTAAYPQLFSKTFFDQPKKGVINFHPSYLPRCRGAHPIYWTIAKREPFGGLSSHFITEKIDKGPILARIKIDFDKHQIYYQELYTKVIKNLPALIHQTGLTLMNNSSPFTDYRNGSYHYEDLDDDHEISWQKDSPEEISAKIRAGNAFVYLHNDTKLKFYEECQLKIWEQNQNSPSSKDYPAILAVKDQQIKLALNSTQYLSTKIYLRLPILLRIINFGLKKILPKKVSIYFQDRLYFQLLKKEFPYY